VNESAKKFKLNRGIFIEGRILIDEAIFEKSFEICENSRLDSKNKKLSLNLNDITNVGKILLLFSQSYIDIFLLKNINLKISFQFTLL